MREGDDRLIDTCERTGLALTSSRLKVDLCFRCWSVLNVKELLIEM